MPRLGRDAGVRVMENPESTAHHDPAINAAFIKLMGHEDVADLARAFVVGLPINDPPAVVEEAPAEVGDCDEVCDCGDAYDDGDTLIDDAIVEDTLTYTDADADRAIFAFCPVEEGIRTEAAVYIATHEIGLLVPIADVPLVIEWLGAQIRKAARG